MAEFFGSVRPFVAMRIFCARCFVQVAVGVVQWNRIKCGRELKYITFARDAGAQAKQHATVLALVVP